MEPFLAALVSITNACFHLTNNVDVCAQVDAAAAWTALPTGEALLDPPAAGDNVDNVCTRMAMPLAHHFVGPAYDAILQGAFSWQWISENVCDVAMADPNLAAGCAELIKYVCVASTC
jgi:hypothetical protein